jgi:benzoylformate decarboxylase
MLYNAFKARSPLVVTAGQQDTRLRLRGPVLGHDLVAMATPVTKWSVQVERADEFALVMHRALKIAGDPPAGPVFVALPIDVMEQETEVEPFPPGRLHQASEPDPQGVREAARLLLESRRPVIVVGDDAASAAAEVAALAEGLGAPVWCEGIRMHQVIPSAHPNFRLGLPFDTVAIRKALDGADVVLLIGGPFFEEVWYAPGSPLPSSAVAIQVESSAERRRAGRPPAPGAVRAARGDRARRRARLSRGSGATKRRAPRSQDPGHSGAARARIPALGSDTGLRPPAHGGDRIGLAGRRHRGR